MIRRVVTDAELDEYVGIWNAITPREPLSSETVRRRWERQPERLYLVAERDGRVVGNGMVGPSDSPGRAFIAIRVLPEARRRGIGSDLYERCAAHALASNPWSLSGHVNEADLDALRFAERRGFREVGRQVELVRELRGDEQWPEPPPGIEIVELTADMRDAAYAVAREAFPDMPLPERMEAPPYEEWEEEEFGGPVAFAAFDGARLVGYAALMQRGRPDLLEHGLTACLRTHRGRGIGTALKQTQLAWAAANGYRELITFTQDGNEAMQAVNRKLGYVDQPAWLSMRRDV